MQIQIELRSFLSVFFVQDGAITFNISTDNKFFPPRPGFAMALEKRTFNWESWEVVQIPI